MCKHIELNKLELAAQRLGFMLVIVQLDGRWVIAENIHDLFAFELPIDIGCNEAEAEAWLTNHLSETAGE